MSIPAPPRLSRTARSARSQITFKALLADHLFHPFFVHCFLRRVSPNSALPPPREAYPGSTSPAGPCSPLVPPAGKGLAARDSGRSSQLGSSDSSRFAPWFFGPSLRRHYPPLVATMASADFSPVLTAEISPGKALNLSLQTARLYLARLGWNLGLTLARTLTARTRPHCQFVFPRSKVRSPLRSASPRGYALRFSTVTSIGPGWLLSANKIQPMLGTRAGA